MSPIIGVKVSIDKNRIRYFQVHTSHRHNFLFPVLFCTCNLNDSALCVCWGGGGVQAFSRIVSLFLTLFFTIIVNTIDVDKLSLTNLVYA